ncbi:MAG TPA: MFS transporter [Puia sp.]|nr:MFS transporter [Puia sp.]
MVTAPKKVINGWAMYDWANSVYNLVITTTFFPIYFLSATEHHFKSTNIPFLGRTFDNGALYSFSLAAAYLIISIFYPILTSIADNRGNKKNFMRFFCYMGATGCSLLFFFDGSNLGWGIGCFILASMGFVGSLVFYNAYLPEIAAPQDQDAVSAKGFSYGYIGSVILQVIGFGLVVALHQKPISLQLTFLLVGLWWAGFAQVTFAVLPKSQGSGVRAGTIFQAAFSEVRKVYREIRKMSVLKRFLRGFFFYSMGVQTVMMAATIFGDKLLHLDEVKLIVTVVLIQLVAIIGATWMSRLSGKFGNFRVLMGVIVIWIMVCISAYLTAGRAEKLSIFHDRIAQLQQQKEDLDARRAKMNAAEYDMQDATIEGELSRWKLDLAPRQEPIEYSFYMLALMVGLVMGGIQSLSRSTYSKLMPETKDTASYFSYYDLTEKIAIVIGMGSFGLITQKLGMKNSVVSLTIFFVIGWAWLYAALIKQNKINTVPTPVV